MEDADYYTDVCRRYHRIRMSLLPYLYSAFVKYQREGIPPVRALVFDYEEEAAVRNVDDEYLLGDVLLVAPMTLEDGTQRKVYLPEGTWHDFWEDIIYEGGREYVIHAEYDRIPVFVRENCILPLADPVEAVGKDTVFTIRPRVYGSGGEGCVLYEDDFETFDYEKGCQNEVRITWDGEIKVCRTGEAGKRYVIAGLE